MTFYPFNFIFQLYNRSSELYPLHLGILILPYRLSGWGVCYGIPLVPRWALIITDIHLFGTAVLLDPQGCYNTPVAIEGSSPPQRSLDLYGLTDGC